MTSVAGIVLTLARNESSTGGRLVLADGTVDPQVDRLLGNPAFLGAIANQFALADVELRIGTIERDTADIPSFAPAAGADYVGKLTAAPAVGQAREELSRKATFPTGDGFKPEAALEVGLSDPYTLRTSTIATITGLVVISALVGLLFAIIVAAYLARRFTTPLRRLTIASRELGGGDMSQRVPTALAETGSVEVAELTRQFNSMAARLQDSMDIIRSDRDRSRDFLADVSHELRTPIAALRTFNDLLREGAVEDPTAADEFLESSAQQIDRLDWLAHNLLELSKLDSGLLQLDLRPDDLRACVESAVDQAEAAARKRGVTLLVVVPERPLRIRHDPQRIGQVVANLVGNALKFSTRGGSVTVTLGPHRDGARIVVADTGVGIDASELPHIFERFYRGSRSNEARASGSGLGLAIVKSIVDMHGGRIAVESRLGVGTTFTVTLPKDPRSNGPERGYGKAGSTPVAPEDGDVRTGTPRVVAAAPAEAPDQSPAGAAGIVEAAPDAALPASGTPVGLEEHPGELAGDPADARQVADSSPSAAQG
jgi:signal transduction histidine kinase